MAELVKSSSRTRKLRTKFPDSISQLPDALLCQILSLLPTKQSVVTGILSKRWKLLWAQVPIIDLDDEMPSDRPELVPVGLGERTRMNFSQFVYSVLMRHEVEPIKKFRLKCSYPNCIEADINTWVGLVTRRRVEQLELSLSVSQFVTLPRSLFNCATIVVLKLNGVFLNALMSFSVNLPSLKTLHVGDRVLFGCHDCIVKLLSGCPLLEDLVIESTYNDACGGPICAHSKFELKLNHLMQARIGFSWKERCQKSMLILFQSLSNVRNLSISLSTVECLKHASASEIPVFNNLVLLEISFGNYFWDLLMNLLENSHKLEDLIIYKESEKSTMVAEPRWNHPAPVPECLLLHLKRFSIRGFQGMESEVDFVGYILENARALETLTIFTTSSLDLEAKLQIGKRLSAFQRNFGTCQLIFH